MDSTLPLNTFVPLNTREIYHEREEINLPNFFTYAHIALVAATEILLLHLLSCSAGDWHSTQYHMHDGRRKTIVKWLAKITYKLGKDALTSHWKGSVNQRGDLQSYLQRPNQTSKKY